MVGLKPTRGRVSAAPANVMMTNPLSIQGSIARSVRDIALLLDIASGPTEGDPFVIPPPSRPFLEEVGVDPGPCRIALSTTRRDGSPVDPECAAAAEAVASLLEELGHHVEPASPPYPLDALSTCMSVYMAAGLAVDVDQRLAHLGRELADDDLEALTRTIYLMGKGLSAAQMVGAMQEVERAARVMGGFFQEHDLLVTPTLACRVPPLGLIDTSDMTSVAAHASVMADLASPYNVTGQPAISLPMGRDRDGLPIGVQLVASFAREDLLIRAASQLEAARPWDTTPVWPAIG